MCALATPAALAGPTVYVTGFGNEFGMFDLATGSFSQIATLALPTGDLMYGMGYGADRYLYGVDFRTKPELASELIRGVGPRIRPGWVTFDEGYGKDPEFLGGLEELGERYIGAVPKTCRGWLRRPEVDEPRAGRRGGRPRSKPRVAPGQPEP